MFPKAMKAMKATKAAAMKAMKANAIKGKAMKARPVKAMKANAMKAGDWRACRLCGCYEPFQYMSEEACMQTDLPTPCVFPRWRVTRRPVRGQGLSIKFF